MVLTDSHHRRSKGGAARRYLRQTPAAGTCARLGRPGAHVDATVPRPLIYSLDPIDSKPDGWQLSPTGQTPDEGE